MEYDEEFAISSSGSSQGGEGQPPPLDSPIQASDDEGRLSVELEIEAGAAEQTVWQQLGEVGPLRLPGLRASAFGCNLLPSVSTCAG